MVLATIEPTTISIIAVCVSVVFGILTFYYNKKSASQKDVSEIERRASENTRVNIKLDEVIASINDIKYDMQATRKDVQNLSVEVATLEASYKSEHKRIDRIERVLDLKREELDEDKK